MEFEHVYVTFRPDHEHLPYAILHAFPFCGLMPVSTVTLGASYMLNTAEHTIRKPGSLNHRLEESHALAMNTHFRLY